MLIPKYEIFDMEKMLFGAVNLTEFWLIAEFRVKSIDAKFLKPLLGVDDHITDHTKFLKKLSITDKSILTDKLPKYIFTTKLNFLDASIKPEKEQMLALLFDTFGCNQVKIIPMTRPVVIVEVWLNDDDDLATLEFYIASNEPLFHF